VLEFPKNNVVGTPTLAREPDAAQGLPGRDGPENLDKSLTWMDRREERTTAINGDAVELALDSADAACLATKLSSRQTKIIQPLMHVADEAKECARSLLARPFLRLL